MGNTLWPAESTFSGPVLVRGDRLDAPGDLRFDGPGGPLLADLRTVVPAAHQPGVPQEIGGWYIRFNAPGCYGLQFDWLEGSEVIAFRARG